MKSGATDDGGILLLNLCDPAFETARVRDEVYRSFERTLKADIIARLAATMPVGPGSFLRELHSFCYRRGGVLVLVPPAGMPAGILAAYRQADTPELARELIYSLRAGSQTPPVG